MACRHPLPRPATRAAPQRSPLPLTLALQAALIAMAWAAPGAQAQTGATAAQAAQTHSIPAGPLDEALSHFAARAGVSITIAPALVQGKRTRGLQGAHGVREGFAQLLAGTGLAAVGGAGGSYVLQPVQAASPEPNAAVPTLATVQVSAAAEAQSAWAPVRGWVARSSASGTKTDASLLETPQSITVITREQMDDQAIQTTSEALRYAAGVRTDYSGAQNAGNALMLRGFTTSGQGGAYLDGLRLRTVGYWAEEPFGVERVEFFKGPSSVLFGQTAVPGGVVALVSKRPTAERRGELELSTGTGSRKHAALDLSGPLNDEGTLLYRMVALGRDADNMYVNHLRDDRVYLAPSLTWKPNARTRFTLLTSYQKNWAHFTSLIPYAAIDGSSPYGRVPMSRDIGDPTFDNDVNALSSVGYEFEHAFNDDWRFQQNFRHSYGHSLMNFVYRTSGLLNGSTIARAYDVRDEWARISTVDNQLKGRFATGPVSHSLLAGVDFMRYESDSRTQGGLAPSINVYAPVYGQPVNTVAYTSRTHQFQKNVQTGFYAQDQLSWGRWVATAGVRHDRVDSQVDNRLTGATVTDRDWSATTYRAGLNYVFDSGFAPYLSYAESFNPVTGTTSPLRGSQPFEPERGVQRELGLKYQPPGLNSFVTLSVFDLRRQNVATLDTQDTRYNVQTGEVRSRGIELEAVGEITPNLKLVGSVSKLDIETTRDNTAANIGKAPARVPEHLAALWVDYLMPAGPAQGLGLGLGVRYTGEAWGDPANTFKVPSYTLLDLAVRYDLGRANPAWKGWQASLNVRNLANKYYVASCAFALGCNLGEGRSAIAKLTYKW